MSINVKVTRLQKKNRAQVEPKLISELIHKRYSIDDEIALRNNYDEDPEKYQEKYQAYMAYRAEVKQAVEEAFNETD